MLRKFKTFKCKLYLSFGNLLWSCNPAKCIVSSFIAFECLFWIPLCIKDRLFFVLEYEFYNSLRLQKLIALIVLALPTMQWHAIQNNAFLCDAIQCNCGLLNLLQSPINNYNLPTCCLFSFLDKFWVLLLYVIKFVFNFCVLVAAHVHQITLSYVQIAKVCCICLRYEQTYLLLPK